MREALQRWEDDREMRERDDPGVKQLQSCAHDNVVHATIYITRCSVLLAASSL